MRGPERSIVIREMEPEDYEGLIRLWDSADLTHHPNGRDSKERTMRDLRNGKPLFLVAEAEGGIVGSLLGTTDGRKGWMNRLAVHPDWQRKGVASSLLEEMERRFDERGILVVCALVQEANARSRALFTGAGYQEDRGVIYCSKRKRPEV